MEPNRVYIVYMHVKWQKIVPRRENSAVVDAIQNNKWGRSKVLSILIFQNLASTNTLLHCFSWRAEVESISRWWDVKDRHAGGNCDVVGFRLHPEIAVVTRHIPLPVSCIMHHACTRAQLLPEVPGTWWSCCSLTNNSQRSLR